MHALNSNLMILRYCGLWRPRGWSKGRNKTVYSLYAFLAVSITYSFALSELIAFAISIDNLEEAINNCVLLLTMLGICCKIANLILKREEIVKLLDILNNDVCRPCGIQEIAIQKRFDERSRKNMLLFAALSSTAVAAITVGSFVENVPQRTLPFKAWLPFDHKSDVGFWIAFLHQISAHAYAATIGTIHDTLFHSLMAQTCGQLNILKSRLRSMPETTRKNKSEISAGDAERIELGKCVRHHQEIFKFVELSNSIFNFVIFVQFSVSTFVICVSTYTLSKTSFLSAEFTFVIAYLACMLVQIFLLCWNGNEVIVESTGISMAVYEMDWAALRQSTKKDLRMIMIRTLEPVKYTSGHVITLSLDSYNGLMKFSYSVFNLLEHTSS